MFVILFPFSYPCRHIIIRNLPEKIIRQIEGGPSSLRRPLRVTSRNTAVTALRPFRPLPPVRVPPKNPIPALPSRPNTKIIFKRLCFNLFLQHLGEVKQDIRTFTLILYIIVHSPSLPKESQGCINHGGYDGAPFSSASLPLCSQTLEAKDTRRHNPGSLEVRVPDEALYLESNLDKNFPGL